jgi:hypothetical protein
MRPRKLDWICDAESKPFCKQIVPRVLLTLSRIGLAHVGHNRHRRIPLILQL